MTILLLTSLVLRMPSLYLVKFEQIPYVDLAAHWAIFLPYVNSPFTANGIPILGDLFHASKEWGECGHYYNGNETRWERQTYFNLPSCPSVLDVLRLHNTDYVSDTMVFGACDHVSQRRRFNIVSKNCQHWVLEVLGRLIEENYISKDIYTQMKLHGFKTGTEAVVASSVRSFRFWNWGS